MSSSTATLDERISLSPYDPDWPALFEQERSTIAAVLGAAAVGIEHFGSTAVPGLEAKSWWRDEAQTTNGCAECPITMESASAACYVRLLMLRRPISLMCLVVGSVAACDQYGGPALSGASTSDSSSSNASSSDGGAASTGALAPGETEAESTTSESSGGEAPSNGLALCEQDFAAFYEPCGDLRYVASSLTEPRVLLVLELPPENGGQWQPHSDFPIEEANAVYELPHAQASLRVLTGVEGDPETFCEQLPEADAVYEATQGTVSVTLLSEPVCLFFCDRFFADVSDVVFTGENGDELAVAALHLPQYTNPAPVHESSICSEGELP